MRNQLKYLLAVIVCLVDPSLTIAVADFKRVDQTHEGDQVSVIKMSVTPAAEPDLALQHRFVLPIHDRVPGNAAVYYLRANGENDLDGPWQKVKTEFGDELDDFLKPKQPMAVDQLRKVADPFDFFVNYHVARASRCRECEWGLAEMDLRGNDTIEFLLPDLNKSRSMSRAIALQTRLAITEGRHGDAAELIRMNLQLAQDFGKQRFLVATLVGLAEANIATETLVEFIASPNAPNVFWSLSELPRPLISGREALSLEMSLAFRLFPGLREAESREPAEGEWDEIVATTLRFLGQESDDASERAVTPQQIQELSTRTFPDAKRRLVESGMPADQIAEMSNERVLMIDAGRQYRQITDGFERLWYLPFHQSKDLLIAADQQLGNHLRFGEQQRTLETRDQDIGSQLAYGLTPAMYAIKSAQMRTQRQIEALRLVEALRMHAAEEGGLPATLSDVRVVPVPPNPLTLKPFVYRLKGQTAIVDLPKSDGVKGIDYRI